MPVLAVGWAVRLGCGSSLPLERSRDAQRSMGVAYAWSRSVAAALALFLLAAPAFCQVESGGAMVGRVKEMEEELSEQESLVCWESARVPPLGALAEGQDLLLGQGQPRRGVQSGVFVHGSGCRACQAGEQCVFAVTVLPPALWETASGDMARRELMVTLIGPSLVHGYVRRDPGDPSTFLVHYRTWDTGTYQLCVRVGCPTLRYAPDMKPSVPHALGPITVTVSNYDPAAAPYLSPCAHSLHARWMWRNNVLEWVPYDCAEYAPLAQVPELLLQRRGIREINLVGDASLKFMLQHLIFLLEGKAHPEWRDPTAPFSHVLVRSGTGGEGEELRFNMYQVDKITPDCRTADDASFPDISKSAQLTLVSTGWWTAAYCPNAEGVLAKHYPRFLEHVAAQVAPGARLILRGMPPIMTCGTRGLNDSNPIFLFANALLHALAPRFNATFFNAWEVEAPRYMDVCDRAWDMHYSCVFKSDTLVDGVVGEAVIRSLFHYILTILPS